MEPVVIQPPSRKIRIVPRPNIKTWTWSQIIADYIPVTWDKVFARTTNERRDIAAILYDKEISKGKELSPSKENLYRAFDITPLPSVRVVIIGQDPYPQPGKAQGLSFSISPNDKSIPGSLKNIYKELKLEYPDFQIPTHGDLTGWARQGVLLLNMALTIPIGERKAHEGVWKAFTYKTVEGIVTFNPQTIFVLWGRPAQKIATYIGNAPVLMSSHPSPEAVNRGGDFIGNGHFKKINAILESMKQEPIDWLI